WSCLSCRPHSCESLLVCCLLQGITRVKSSSDVVGALMKELRLQSGRPDAAFRLAVAVDGVNALWGRTTLKKENKIPVDPEELTLIYNLRKLMEDKWVRREEASTAAASKRRIFVYLLSPKTTFYLFYFLSSAHPVKCCVICVFPPQRGFDAMDPFIPMLVSNYSEEEFESCYLYYIERNWLQHPQSRTEAGKKELVFLSSRNPTVFDKICRSL
ncbi:28S ribosomal protein S29, mitochondrial, partial [Austrofundulus limnaeus]|uniref:Small ribosomal subunit protein mS29 n=1 Tax=Austrofundulus limnaeus TaxID=52670 RepID=A0A2I4ALD2_AUSLI